MNFNISHQILPKPNYQSYIAIKKFGVDHMFSCFSKVLPRVHLFEEENTVIL